MAQNSRNNDDKKFVDGFFGKVFWRGGNDKFLADIGIKKKEMIDFLDGLEENERGFINLTMGTQRENTDKLTLWVKEERGSGYEKEQPKKSHSSSTTKSKSNNDGIDTLPF